MPSHPVIESVGHTKLINMRANRLEHVGWAALKRAFDVVCSFFGRIVLSPMLLAVAVGGGLMGVVGMFLMVPIASVIYTLIREGTAKRLETKQIDESKLVEQPPELQSHFALKAKNARNKRIARREERRNKKSEDKET